jgi:hypothetical protein
MSKTHSPSLSKETLVALGIVIGYFFLMFLMISLLVPSAIELLQPSKTNIQADPIDRKTVNEAIKYIQQ